MGKVTGIGGIFFKCSNPETLRTWYQQHLGISSENWGSIFFWKNDPFPKEEAYTLWSPFKSDSTYFEPSNASFMINFRVENLDELMQDLAKENILCVGEPQSSEFGKFAWIMDPEGNKIELWEPPRQ